MGLKNLFSYRLFRLMVSSRVTDIHNRFSSCSSPLAEGGLDQGRYRKLFYVRMGLIFCRVSVKRTANC